MNDENIYQRIGEFVVCFQFVEDKIRQIGWLLIDPGRKVWPPQALRNLTAENLTKEVGKLYGDKLPLCRLPDESERIAEFTALLEAFHDLRRFRNRILHSAYHEIKGGGEVLALMRSNPKFMTDPDTGEKGVDQEMLSESSFDAEMKQMGEVAFSLGQHYLQLIARLPVE